ncbi:hypothetical protein Ciccas_010544 [Cichlidogyrus casuarinus]|uniref:Uncharacterized protein n=1 Tax=Cichlidogyrus casuarinus TaxID=1844966 RepID=A0ABD2PTU0_9PLAT
MNQNCPCPNGSCCQNCVRLGSDPCTVYPVKATTCCKTRYTVLRPEYYECTRCFESCTPCNVPCAPTQVSCCGGGCGGGYGGCGGCCNGCCC